MKLKEKINNQDLKNAIPPNQNPLSSKTRVDPLFKRKRKNLIHVALMKHLSTAVPVFPNVIQACSEAMKRGHWLAIATSARFWNTLPSHVSFLDLIVSFLNLIVSIFRSHCFILEGGGDSRIAPLLLAK